MNIENENLDIFKDQIKKCIAFASGFFVVSILLGFQIALQNPREIEKVLENIIDEFSKINELSNTYIFLFIFINNVIKSFLTLLGGFLFGILPLVFLFLNGEIIGFVFGLWQANGNGFLKILVGVLPHGIFEIPAILLATGYGIWLGWRFFLLLFRKEEFKSCFYYALRKYFTLVLPLLLLAALIETFITPALLNYFF